MVIESLQRDLARIISGEVFTDPVSREIYAGAACLYRIVPLAVVRPINAEEAARVVEFAATRGITVTPRGAGTAVAGQTLGEGIIIDLAAHLNRVIEVDAEKRTATVEPGVILGELNKELEAHGLVFPPDPSSGDYATVGGMIANNSSGAHALKYRDTRHWTSRLKCVLADGSITWLDKKPVMPERTAHESGIFENRIYGGLPPLLHNYSEDLDRERPVVLKNSAGYHVWDLLHGRLLDPVPLMVGSEGTLGLVVKAVLELAPLPAERRAVLIATRSLEGAVAAVEELRKLSPAAIEIMDHMFIRTVRQYRRDLRELLPEKVQAILLVEFESEEENELESLVSRARKAVNADDREVVLYKAAKDESESRLLWTVRKAASPILYRMPGKRLTRFVEDVVVPPPQLAEAIRGIRDILNKYDTEAPVLGHAGSGNLHLNPRLDLTDPQDRQKMKRIANEIYELVIALQGSITGEHGDGILRAPYVKKQFPALYPLFKEIKQLFDPQGILNPGKILSRDDEIPLEHLKHKGRPEHGRAGALQEEPVMEMLLRCHGCGLCRTYCPITCAVRDEKAMPRSKISLLRAVAQGELDPGNEAISKDLDMVFNLCTSCQRCLTGCPTGIETARLIHAFYHDFPPSLTMPDKLLARAPSMLSTMARAPRAASWLLQNIPLRFVMEKTAGLRKDAALPSPSHDTVASLFEKKAGGKKVAYFPGCLARYADREGEAEAAVSVLGALGFSVQTANLPCCGGPLILSNQLEKARAKAEEFVQAAGKYVDEDTPLVTTCPACALTLQYQYRWLLGERAGTLPGRVFELFRFVDLHLDPESLAGLLRKSSSQSVINFRSCHYAALSDEDHVSRVLKAVPGLSVDVINGVCCGLAGTYGVKAENRELSDKLAFALEGRLKETGAGMVISGCPLCRLQIRRLGHQVQSAAAFLYNRL